MTPFFPRIISSIEQEAFQSNFVLKYTYSMLEFQTEKRFRNIVYVEAECDQVLCDCFFCRSGYRTLFL